MKKALILLCIFTLLLGSALADAVVQMSWCVPVEGEVLTGEYTGNTDNGVPNGFGVFQADGDNSFAWDYVGQWQNGLMHGAGATYWSDGSFEHGEYENGRFVFGTFCYSGAQADVFADTGSEYVIQLDREAAFRQDEIIYVGNVYTHKFHLATCEYAVSISQKNKIIFSSREEAVQAGFEPCHSCDP